LKGAFVIRVDVLLSGFGLADATFDKFDFAVVLLILRRTHNGLLDIGGSLHGVNNINSTGALPKYYQLIIVDAKGRLP
jgi:hypothetical protein